MELNDQNRNFTISSKVSSSQKAKYIQEAGRLIFLSEWMCGTLDMSINAYEDVNKIIEVKRLQEDSGEKDKKINKLSSSLEIVKSHLDLIKYINIKKDKTILELKNIIQDMQIRFDNYRVSQIESK